MIRFLLQELEKSPNPIFSKKELVSISPRDFEDLRKRKILTYFRPSDSDMERVRFPRCQHGCTLTVVPVEGGLEAICLDHPEEDPIPIEKDDLSRYAFSVDKFLFELRGANRIEGEFHRINGGYFYIGCKTYNNGQVGFIFILRIGDKELIKLSGLKHLYEDDDILIVLTPASTIEDVLLRRNLRHDRIIRTSLVSSLNLHTFELPIEELMSGLLKPGAELSERQRKDYEEFEYQCYDRIHIPGTIPMGRSNVIVVNGDEVRIGDSLLALLLRFVVESKRGEGGWVDVRTLDSEGIVTNVTEDVFRYQIYSRLRTQLKGSLLGRNAQKFIQSDRAGYYRISTHPDFITYDKEKLLKHQHPPVKRVAEKLP